MYNESNQLIGEYDTSGNVINEYIYFGLRPVAVKNNGNIHMVHTDYLGTPRYVTDSSNSVVWKWENLNPYGSNLPQGNLEFNLRFAGQYYDSESGLHYNMFRTYDPSSKRYMQSDPLGLVAGNNTYNYVGRNPLNYIDPLGLSRFMGYDSVKKDGKIHFYHCDALNRLIERERNYDLFMLEQQYSLDEIYDLIKNRPESQYYYLLKLFNENDNTYFSQNDLYIINSLKILLNKELYKNEIKLKYKVFIPQILERVKKIEEKEEYYEIYKQYLTDKIEELK